MVINLRQENIPRGWQVCTLPEFTKIVMGQSPSSSTYNYDQVGLPFYQGKTEFGKIYPSVNKYCSSPNKIAQKGATLLSVRAPVGPTNLALNECCIGRGLAAIHPLDIIDSKFILFLFRCIEPNLSGCGTGSTFKAITKIFVEELQFALPPLNEQHRIVAKIEELFSELDKGIESLKTAREQLKLYRQSLLKHAFEGKLTEQWRKDNADKLETADELLARIQQEREIRFQQQLDEWQQAAERWEVAGKEGKKPSKPRKYKPTSFDGNTIDKLDDIPNSWLWISFSELLYSIRGGTTVPPVDIVTKYPILRSSSIRTGCIDFDDVRYLAHEKIKSKSDFVEKNDLLFSRLNGTIDFVGNCAVVGPVFPENLIYPDRLYCAKLVAKSLATYCEYFFSTSKVRKQIEEHAKSTAGHKRISIPDITDLPFQLPPLDEATEISKILDEKLSVVDQIEKAIAENLLKAQALRQSILKKAFSGQLVPQDPNDEPASELLKRIAAEKAQQSKLVKSKTRHTVATIPLEPLSLKKQGKNGHKNNEC